MATAVYEMRPGPRGEDPQFRQIALVKFGKGMVQLPTPAGTFNLQPHSMGHDVVGGWDMSDGSGGRPYDFTVFGNGHADSQLPESEPVQVIGSHGEVVIFQHEPDPTLLNRLQEIFSVTIR